MQVHISCLYVENEIESLKKKLCECPPRILVIDFYVIKLCFPYIIHNPVLTSQIRPRIDLISIHFLLAVKKENNLKIGVKQFSYSFRSGYESLGLANLDCIMNLSLPIGIKLLRR